MDGSVPSDEKVLIGRSNINMSRLVAFTVSGMLCRQISPSRQQFGKKAARVGCHVDDYEDGSAEICRKSARQIDQRFDTSRRSADHNNSLGRHMASYPPVKQKGCPSERYNPHLMLTQLPKKAASHREADIPNYKAVRFFPSSASVAPRAGSRRSPRC